MAKEVREMSGGFGEGSEFEPTCQPANDAVLENFAWCLTRADRARPDERVGPWVQMAHYGPAILARLRQAELERDTHMANLRRALCRQQELLLIAYNALIGGEQIDPHRLIAYLSHEMDQLCRTPRRDLR